jgi:hypothetical protein
MMSRGSIAFYINGPPPTVKLTDSPGETLNPTPSEVMVPEKVDIPQDLNSLTCKTKNTLLTIRSMRLFDLFPDKLIIDENKVSFIYKDAFGVKSIHSVLIENITYVEAHTSLICGSLVVVDSSNYRHPIELKIDNIRKEAAIRARKLIQSLVHAKTLKVDFSKYSAFDLENDLEELGKVVGED